MNLDPTIIAVATDPFHGGFIRAVVTQYDPGAGCELVLERYTYGDEASPHRLVKQHDVTYAGEPPGKLYFLDGCLYLVERDDGRKPRTYYVRASATEFGDKAHRET